MRRLINEYGIDNVKSGPNYPQGNSKAEAPKKDLDSYSQHDGLGGTY